MANRLTKIYTRGGDTGTTGLGTNDRVAKHAPRINALGDVDEVNSWIGHIRSALTQPHLIDPVLSQIQHDLFDIGGELAMPGFELVSPDLVDELEQHIDRLNEALPPLENFILPAGNETCSRVHIARAVARRAERQLWALREVDDSVSLRAIQYLNRLSDFLFVLSRTVAREDGGQEVLWQSRHTSS